MGQQQHQHHQQQQQQQQLMRPVQSTPLLPSPHNPPQDPPRHPHHYPSYPQQYGQRYQPQSQRGNAASQALDEGMDCTGDMNSKSALSFIQSQRLANASSGNVPETKPQEVVPVKPVAKQLPSWLKEALASIKKDGE